VTLLVLGIGLLGLAALQVTGLRVNDGALLRTRASLVAYDLADRLRADPGAFFARGQAQQGIVAVGPNDCDPPPGGANAVERWQRDVCRLQGRDPADPGVRLPAPANGDAASVDCRGGNSCGAGNCAIVIRWSDARGEAQVGNGDGDGDSEFRFCTRIATAI
jgi:type IV pilus assembly protein PilV